MEMQGASSFGYVIEEHWSIRFDENRIGFQRLE